MKTKLQVSKSTDSVNSTKLTRFPLALDIWSVGTILLSFLSGKFPIFNANDDVEALMEIAAILGKRKMEKCAQLHSEDFPVLVLHSLLTSDRFYQIVRLFATSRQSTTPASVGGRWQNVSTLPSSHQPHRRIQETNINGPQTHFSLLRSTCWKTCCCPT